MMEKKEPAVGKSPDPGQAKGSHAVFEGFVQEVVIHLLKTLREHIREERTTIESLIQIVESRAGGWAQKGPIGKQLKQTSKTAEFPSLTTMQAAVHALSLTSQQLCQKLFDLNQKCVQEELLRRQKQTREIQEIYQAECKRLRKSFALQKGELEQTIQNYKSKCEELMEQASERNRDKVRKEQLGVNLRAIQDIRNQILFLQEDNQKKGAYFMDDSIQKSETAFTSRKSRECYCSLKDKGVRPQRQILRIQNYSESNDYYAGQLPRKEQVLIVDKVPTTLTTRENTHNKGRNSEQNYQAEPNHRRNFPTFQKVESVKASRLASSESRYFPSRAKEDGFALRSIDLKKVEEKNQRLKQVEGRLEGLKRTLQKEVRTMILK